ncbi:MAG: SPOR domain-containing protein [Rhodobacteraceae bacterium]|nr:SPOR domain-containing protein [Paracoccaceae bacterium]
MADIEYYDDDDDAAAPRTAPSRLTVLANWAGALTSLALMSGMVLWVWQLTTRDVTGVPVIQALEGAMRVAPANPGGSQAAHQGLTVNRIAEGREAEPAADRIVLAPPPVSLARVNTSPAGVPGVLPEAGAVTAPEAPTPQEAGEAAQGLISRLMRDEAASAGAENPAEAPATAPAQVDAAADDPVRGAIAVIPTSVLGVRQSPRPARRPAGLRGAFPAPPNGGDGTPGGDTVAPATRAVAFMADIDPASLKTGTPLVQLGAFDAPETARTEWIRLTQTFPDFFAGRARVVQPAVSGGRTFFRLRAHGFSALDDARRFCAALRAQGAACIPVTVR